MGGGQPGLQGGCRVHQRQGGRDLGGRAGPRRFLGNSDQSKSENCKVRFYDLHKVQRKVDRLLHIIVIVTAMIQLLSLCRMYKSLLPNLAIKVDLSLAQIWRRL